MHTLNNPKINVCLWKNVNILISLVIFSGITTRIYYIYMNKQNVSSAAPYVIHLRAVDNNISCHYIEEGDALRSADDPSFTPRPNSIFFHETSCRGGLDSRQACAVESAARAHPRRQVYVLFSAPVSDLIYQRSCIAKLRYFPNVRIARVHIAEYAKNTLLESMVASSPVAGSKWRVEHTADILRYLTLYKWGGVVLDTDMMVVKSLTPLGRNWVGKEHVGAVSVGAVAISMDNIGRRFANATIYELSYSYRPDIWIHNGPGTMMRVLRKMCLTPDILDWSASTCQGFEVYESEYLYPVHYTYKENYFKGDLQNFEEAYTHHFWNQLTYNMQIKKDSPYAKIAQKYCPTIYEMYGDEFGS